MRNPPDREEANDRNLQSHEELPKVGGCSFIRLRRGPKTGDMGQYHCDGKERDGDRKKRARMPEDIRTDSFNVHGGLAGLSGNLTWCAAIQSKRIREMS